MSKRKHKCKECKELGHMMKICPLLYPKGKPRNRKRKNVEPQDIEDIEANAIDAETTSATKKKTGGGRRAKSSSKSMLQTTVVSSPHPEASKMTCATHQWRRTKKN